jgi:hypothetical protein
MKTKANSTALESLTFGAMISTLVSVTYFVIANFLV